MIFWIIFLLFFIISLWFVHYMGFHHKINIYKTQFSSKLFIYEHYIGNIRNISSKYEALVKSLLPYFPNAILAGIYYDNPMRVVDPDTCRAVVGVIMDASEKEKAKEFVEKQANLTNPSLPAFEFKELPSINAITTSYLWRNKLSFIWASIKIYSAIFNYMLTNNIPMQRTGILELYHFNDNINPKTVELIVPYGDKAEEFFLTNAQAPKLKPDVYKRDQGGRKR